MPHLTLPTEVGTGPIISAWINPSTPRVQALKAAGITVPTPKAVKFLVDTGASCTAVDEEIIKSLGLVPTGQTPILTPTTKGQPENRFVYDVAIILYHDDNSRFFHTIPVISTDFKLQNIGGLIGRDILEKCLLVYDGADKKFSLAF